MAAVFAACAHAPITAVLILFEMTGDYRIILPLMLTVVVATLLAQWMLKGESIYTLKLTRRGIRLQRGRDLDVMQGVSVSEIMTRDLDTVPCDLTLPQLAERFGQTQHHGFPVLDAEGNLWGVITIEDLQRAINRNMPRATTVAEIGTHEHLLVAYPDESMEAALARMSTRDVGRLPVVDRDDPRRLVGLIRRNDIVNAYRVALARRAEIQHRTKRMQLRNLDGTEFVELTLAEGDRAIGRTIGEIARALPYECVLVSIRRGSAVIIPHGDTVFQAEDHITAFASTSQVQHLHTCLRGERAPSPDQAGVLSSQPERGVTRHH
jgi:CIC family chloride channel protein